MRHRLWIWAAVTILPLLNWAQCAMCRTQVVNNVSAGEYTFAKSLNTGILMLFAAPYVLLSVVAFVWYRNARRKK